MSLTPDEIVNYPLKQAVRGYSVKQVDELLDQVADTLERMQIEMEDLRNRLMRAEQQLAATSETDATLKRTLVTAQRAAEQSLDEARTRSEELVEDARREAAAVVEQAKLDAEELRLDAVQAARAEEAEIRRRRRALERHIAELQAFERDYRDRLRSLIDEQSRLLEDIQMRPPVPPEDDLPSEFEAEEPVAREERTPAASNPHLGTAATARVPGERPLTVRVRHEHEDVPGDGREDALFVGQDDQEGGDPDEGSHDHPGRDDAGD